MVELLTDVVMVCAAVMCFALGFLAGK